MKNPMLDEEFLNELDHYHHHHTWAKIVSLNFDEYPQAEITGKITSGNVNIDGASALRRTCSLSLVTEDVNVQNFYWGLHTKFYVYIGLENHINPEYSDIIWFKQGMFMITSFSCTVGINNCTINIQGKDKMTLLNGDLGGVIPASWDFGTEDANATDENGNTLYDATGYAIVENHQIPIKQIILEAVHEFAQEPWQNIIVNDLDDFGIELLEYEGDTPFYYLIGYSDSGPGSREVIQMTPYGDTEIFIRQDSWDSDNNVRIIGSWSQTKVKISELEFEPDTDGTLVRGTFSYEKLIDQLDPRGEVTESSEYLRAVCRMEDNDDAELFTVAKITNDPSMKVCGYRVCDIIYPYDLILSPGDTVTGMLDKLIKMLGNFEYFYDVDGRFIFQKKRTYLDVSYNNLINEHNINEETWANSEKYSSKYSYNFEGSELLSSIQNAPNLSNLKNDFSLWGARTNGNITIPIHMRYGINHKPLFYKTIGHTLKRDKYGNAYHYLGELNDDNYRSIVFYPGNIYYIANENGYNINTAEETLTGWIICELQNDGKNLIFRNIEFTEDEQNCLIKYEYIFTDAGMVYVSKRGFKELPESLKENIQEVVKAEIEMYQSNLELSITLQNNTNNDNVEPSGATLLDDEEKPSILDVISQEELDNIYLTNLENFIEGRRLIAEKYLESAEEYTDAMEKYLMVFAEYEQKYIEAQERLMLLDIYEDHLENLNNWRSNMAEPTLNYNFESSLAKMEEIINLVNTQIEDDIASEEEQVITEIKQTIIPFESSIKFVDWREIIYQMANDYRRHYHDIDFLELIKENNEYDIEDNMRESFYPKGYTGYEQYYIDFEMNLSQGVVAYWRELYNPNAAGQQGRYLSWGKFQTFEEDYPETNIWNKDTVYNKGDRVILKETKKNSNDEDVIVTTYWKSLKNKNIKKPSSSNNNWLEEVGGTFKYNQEGWNVNILDNPELLNFWFDFIDTTGELNKYGVNNIGLRTKATNDDKIKAIYFREVPNVIFDVKGEEIVGMKEKYWKPGYSYINIPKDFMNYFHISSRGKNMMDVVEEYLYSYTYPASSITLTSIPIYYLTPNTLIYVYDDKTGIAGEYIMNKFSLQLGLNAAMTVNAVETTKRIY